MKLHIITIATDINRLAYLQYTANNFNLEINYIILKEWRGFIDKILYINNALKEIPDNDLVCFIDAYDVLINTDYNEIIKKFMEYDCDLLFGAELNCYPNKYKKELDEINKSINNYKYPNSGGYIGYKYAIVELFSWKDINQIYEITLDGGDQSYFIEYYISKMKDGLEKSDKESEKSDKITLKLDYQCKIFQNFYFVSWDEVEIKNGNVYNIILNEKPCFLHFNGFSYRTHDDKIILEALIYKMLLSKNNGEILNLNEYKQYQSEEYFIHPQV